MASTRSSVVSVTRSRSRKNSKETTHSRESGIGLGQSEEEVPEEEPYRPPPLNFIWALYGDEQAVLLNNNVRKKIFTDYMKEKASISSDNLDMLDLKGRLVGLQSLGTNDYVTALFQQSEEYVPCVVTKNEDGVIVAIQPYLEHWETTHPRMIETIDSTIKESAAEYSQRVKAAHERERQRERDIKEREKKEEKKKAAAK